MNPLPRISGEEAVKAFERAGWLVARRKERHTLLTHPDVAPVLAVPDYEELSPELLRCLIQRAGLSVALEVLKVSR